MNEQEITDAFLKFGETAKPNETGGFLYSQFDNDKQYQVKTIVGCALCRGTKIVLSPDADRQFELCPECKESK